MAESKNAQDYLESLDEEAFEALFEGKEDASFEDVVDILRQSAESAGFSASSEELEKLLADSSEESDELSDEELEDVAGGAGKGRVKRRLRYWRHFYGRSVKKKISSAKAFRKHKKGKSKRKGSSSSSS